MAFNNGDQIYACIRAQNVIPIGETTPTERVHRGTVAVPGQWSIGDTVKVKESGGDFKFFGFNRGDDLNDNVLLTDSSGVIIETTTAGQGSDDVTLTLTEAGPAGEDLVVSYRVGVPGTFVDQRTDRGNVLIEQYDVTLNGPERSWLSVFNQEHQMSDSMKVKQSQVVDGMTIQSNPPA